MRRSLIAVLAIGLGCASVPVEQSRPPDKGPVLAPRLSAAELQVWREFLASGERLVDAARARADTVALIDLSRRLSENRAEAERLHGSLSPALARRVRRPR